jgi:hypothetical protein
MDGNGTYYNVNGTEDMGYSANDTFSGYGVRPRPNDDSYEGNWKDDNMDGNSTTYFAGRDKYMGDLVNNTINRKGMGPWPKNDRYKETANDNTKHT